MKRIVFSILFIFTAFINIYAIDKGVYIIRSACNRNYVIDNNGCNSADGNNIHIWELNYSAAQKWLVVPFKDGTYGFVIYENVNGSDNVRDFHMLDLNGALCYNGNNIHLYTFNGSGAQKWHIVGNGDGTYRIESSINRGYVVDLNGCNATNGNNIHIWEWNQSCAQRWIFERIR